jgi:hypothetical protein
MSWMNDAADRLVRQAPLLLVVLIAAIVIVVSALSSNTPEVSGIYTSACCKPIRIEKNTILYNGAEAGLVVKSTKFGVRGYTSKPLREFHNRTGRERSDSPVLVFSTDLKSFTIMDSRGREHLFERAITETVH